MLAYTTYTYATHHSKTKQHTSNMLQASYAWTMNPCI